MNDPIAIVGMACKFPGAPDLASFWKLLESGGNAITQGVPGSGVGRLGNIIRDSDVQNEACRYGAFVDDIDQFDAPFFRISPVEANLLDPQQRMMLEMSWLALEDAAINPDTLKGSRTGVYTGISNDEYRMLVLDTMRPTEAAGSLYALSGTNLNGTSGRVSFVLGLMGPAKAVDAACASAMVAVHDAVADLQQGRTDLAIAGGVQAIMNGRVYQLRAEAMMLSPDGQCKTFDASANGYVRGEGCGVVVLKRLGEAEADGDPIWAVIRGSAVNNGGTGIGLTVPHTPALIQVMETALADAEVNPREIDFIEAHGTGTAVGDPVELDAVASVYGQDREADRPLLIGSVKTNIGHLESAAGIAGLIKAALVVKKGVIPKHLHFHDPHPSFDWENQPLQVTSTMMDWPRRRELPRLAGVNSFGITGTNSHIVVEEYLGSNGATASSAQTAGPSRAVGVSLPAPMVELPSPKEESSQRKARFLPLSGKSEPALKDLAKAYLSWLDKQEEEAGSEGAAWEPTLSDMAWTAGVGRSHLDCRAGAVFHDAASLRKGLETLAEPGTGTEPRAASKVAFVYTGQGSQWLGMGQDLYETEPVARAVLDRCEEVFQDIRGASLLDVMFGRPGTKGDLSDTAWEQPALYALECAVTALWSSVGVQPSVVLGHSVGEIAAAQAAGAFSLEDGMRFAATRGTLLSATEPGAMAAVFAPRARVESEVQALNSSSNGVGLSIAADNGSHIVVSGPVEGIEAATSHFESQSIGVRRLNTSRAFHSALLDPALDPLETYLEGVATMSPSLTVISNLTGQPVGPDMALDAAYWRRHAREPVAFADGVKALAHLGVDMIVEVGPHAVLGPMASQAWPDGDGQQAVSSAPVVLASLRRPPRNGTTVEPECSFVCAVAEAYEAGLEISFDGLFAGESRRRVSLPSYPFQRERYWIETSRSERPRTGHPLMGIRHESARGEVTYENEVSPSEPAWLKDHRVFGRLVAPGALYGAMAASAALAEGGRWSVVDELQLHSPLVFSEEASGGATTEDTRKIQIVLDIDDQGPSRRVQLFSKGSDEKWTMHIEGHIVSDPRLPDAAERIDLEELKRRLSPADVPAYYRAKSDTGIDLGPLFRTLGRCWSGPGEALGEVALPEVLGRNPLDVHPLLLDGCFQVVGVARNMGIGPEEATYLPFGWERLWLTNRLPDRILCHVRMNETDQEGESSVGPAEVLSGELRIYDPSGALLGGLKGYTVKRATRAALLSAVEGIDDLLYEVIWQDRALPSGIKSADFFPSTDEVAAGTPLFTTYLSEAGVDPKGRNDLLADLERWSWSRSLATLEELGWQRSKGEEVDSEELRQRLDVLPDHSRLFRRMLEMLVRSGVLEEKGEGFAVIVGPEAPLPEAMPRDLEEYAAKMASTYSDGQTEIGLFLRSGKALAEVLRGQADPLTLLFSSGEPTAADLYLKAPVARAANRMLADAVQKLVAALPNGRRLRVIEVGAGTGSATASVLPELSEGQFDYTYTDISAGFFAEAEARFGTDGIEYRPLDIERDPIAQGFDSHGYDILIASNVLHATRYLEETLGHCLDLLAPSGHLVALENLRGLGWMDLTFGQLDGWWRYADSYRPNHALAGPPVWRQALRDAGFEGAEVLGVDDSYTHEMLDKGVIVAQGPAHVAEPPGLWILTADRGGVAEEIAGALAARNQMVVLARDAASDGVGHVGADSVVSESSADMGSRESWRSLLEGLPKDVPFSGMVHLHGLEGHGPGATTGEIEEDLRHVGASALALVQGMGDAGLTPEKGVWFLTRGSQVLEREPNGELVGAVLWGMGKVVSLEAPHLQPRMIDLESATPVPMSDLLNELMHPDRENHIAYRQGRRQSARLVRRGAAGERLALPEDPDWVLAPNQKGVFDRPEVKRLPVRSLDPREVRVSVEATGLNFWDVFRSLGFIEEGDLGREMCGYVLDIGQDVSSVSVGDRVVGLGFGAFGPEIVTREELVAPAPSVISASSLATIPSAFVSAALSYQFSGLEAGDRVLIHAGAGGVGLAAIQLAQAAGAEVFATASAPKQGYLRSLGVKHVFDSRQTKFAEEILEATGGEGVHVVLNSLTSEGFIDASLSCLAHGGRFVELARRDILSEEEMAALRPDVAYAILELDVMKKTVPGEVGVVLREVMAQLSAGQLRPLVHSRWPLAEAGAALGFMRSARHMGKIVLTPSPIMDGRLRADRTYLVTGGLGGIGCAVAAWLADHGAGVIVLNGRRPSDPDAEDAIEALRQRGADIRVELADVTDAEAMDAMLERIDGGLPPLGGVIHSVGVLSDAALENQTWASFEQVLRPKIIGAWHLHRATMDRDLDFFILFSSRVGVMGNPGQANHAAANAFLDQLAGHRRALGLPGQAIAWGAWSEIGEAAEQRERIERRRAALGGRWFTPEQGIKALERLVRQDSTTSVVMSVDWSVFEEAVRERPPLLEELLSSDGGDTDDTAASSGDVLAQLRGATAPTTLEALVSFLQKEVQAVLRMPAPPTPTVGFFDLGMDSLMSVELRNRLNRALSGLCTVSNTAVFDYPNVNALASHLREELGSALGTGSPETLDDPETARPRVTREATGEPVAIVGMACRFPGAPDLASFWDLLESGGVAVSDGRKDEGDWAGVTGDPAADDILYRRGGFVEGIDRFDNRFFRISPIEARMMDPQQRMLLETTWHALEDAGIAPESLRGSQTGVYVGIGFSEYRDVISSKGQEDLYFGTAGSLAIGRIAFVLGLEGPAMPMDMACASSLAALHQAAAALQRGEVEMALAGGVNATLSPAIVRFHHEMGMLSPSGMCSAFDASADGFVRGEGCGMVVLKRLSDAEADGDRIWALIRGSSVNQNGASAALPVPRGPAQERLIREALERAGVLPSDVDYMEAHGTGTELGDSIELRAVAAVYGEGRDQERPLLVGSVKPNIGHAEWAAGMASLMKAVLAMKRGAIPAHLNFREPNPNFDWERMPVRVTSDVTEWPSLPSRRPLSAVNSFGLSGTNAHLILEGYDRPINGHQSQGDVPERMARLLPLSGKSPAALRDLAKSYQSWFEGRDSVLLPEEGECLLADMSWTAGVGRSHFPYRSGLVFGDADELEAKLSTVAAAEDDSDATERTTMVNVAFVYTGQGDLDLDMGEALYRSGPAPKAVLDRCDQVMRDVRGVSLLDVMFGAAGTEHSLQDPAWQKPALYAMQAAIAALWESVGVKPDRVLGRGAGEIAAARAAGLFSLEDGCRLAASLAGPELALPQTGTISSTWISNVLLRAIQPSDDVGEAHWRGLSDENHAFRGCVRALAGAGADLVVEVGPSSGPAFSSYWPQGADGGPSPAFIEGLLSPDGGSENLERRFLDAVSAAYEAGAGISFAGLYAGEERRRIGIPHYPFQRRSFWVQGRSQG